MARRRGDIRALARSIPPARQTLSVAVVSDPMLARRPNETRPGGTALLLGGMAQERAPGVCGRYQRIESGASHGDAVSRANGRIADVRPCRRMQPPSPFRFEAPSFADARGAQRETSARQIVGSQRLDIRVPRMRCASNDRPIIHDDKTVIRSEKDVSQIIFVGGTALQHLC